MSSSIAALSLSELGNLPPTYRHAWKVAEPQEPIIVPGAVFKWYHVRDEDMTVPAELDAEARAHIITAAASGEWDLSYGLNIALLHQTRAQAIVIAGVWRGHNELWERIVARELAAAAPLQLVQPAGGATPAACVWEFGVICHERMAWHRYLFSERSDDDKRAWLADTYSGRV